MIATIFLIVLGVYLVCGLVFAVCFAIAGVAKIDAHAKSSGWGFRLLIIPGAMALWPFLARRWIAGVGHPPEECTSHRRLAGKGNLP